MKTRLVIECENFEQNPVLHYITWAKWRFSFCDENNNDISRESPRIFDDILTWKAPWDINPSSYDFSSKFIDGHKWN